MDMAFQRLRLDCEELSGVLHVEEVVAINRLVTDPENFVDPDGWSIETAVTRTDMGPEFEVGRKEDYHEVASIGIIESLIEIILPYECRENNDVVWLTAVIMSEIAQNQAFYEGNKRTAYIAGTLFLVKCQLMERDNAAYPILDRELTDKLALLAVGNSGEDDSIGREEFYIYLKERLGDQAEM